MSDAVFECVQLIKHAKTIAALTGAGISTKAGIPDFRGPQGLYVTRRYDPDKVFDIHYFYRDPKPFYEFARDFVVRRPRLLRFATQKRSKTGGVAHHKLEAANHPERPRRYVGGVEGLPLPEKQFQPTFTHRFLAELEKTGKLKGVVTQNIDSLHQMAGSQKVYEMHGSFWLSYCLQCRKEFSYEQMKVKLNEGSGSFRPRNPERSPEATPRGGVEGSLVRDPSIRPAGSLRVTPEQKNSPRGQLNKEEIPLCSCGGIIKPDIVFFGENVKHLAESEALAAAADLFFVIGTSCVVYPAAMIPQYVTGRIVVVNQDPVALDLDNVVLTVQEDIDAFFSKVAEQLAGPIHSRKGE